VWGACGKVRLLKNIAGLWLLQECRRAWALEGFEFTYDDLAQQAAAAKPFPAILDPDAFLEPGDMPTRISDYCKSTRQRPPASSAEISRMILESLALRYRQVLEMIESLLDRRFAVIHIVGGGSQNQVLNQFVADATGGLDNAGPSKAPEFENVQIEAMGAGELGGLEEARAVVRRSFPTRVNEPAPKADWNAAYEKYRRLVE